MDLSNIISSECLAYANGIKIFRVVKNVNDCHVLGNSLNVINLWYVENHMALNIGKCQITTFTKNKNPISHQHKVNGPHSISCCCA